MKFEDWFDEVEVFGLRSERFFDDLYAYKFDGVDAAHLVKWLKAAYNAGHDHAMNNLMDDGK